MNKELKDIFLVEDKNILDVSSWEKYAEKKDLEKNYYSEYYKKNFYEKEVSVGVFYELDSERKASESIHHIAWGYRTDKDCSYNAKVRENKFIENIIAGCPCDDLPPARPVSNKYRKYLPIYLFLTLTIILSLVYSYTFEMFDAMSFMKNYMAFFFLIFGGLKIINLKNFVKMFATYDLVAIRYKSWGYSYPFIEIFLGINYLFFYNNILNYITIILSSLLCVGIYKKLKKGGITQCACLGGFFNVPLSWLTFYENLIMFLMAIFMIF